MNGTILAFALLLTLGGGLSLMAMRDGGLGGGMLTCSSMHPSATGSHMQCAQESTAPSHWSCDGMGMSAAECDRMASYMGGPGMTSRCH